MKENNSKSITLYYDLGCKRDREDGFTVLGDTINLTQKV